MDAGYDYVKLVENAIRIVERVVGKDIGFGAAQQLHAHGLLYSRNLIPLSLQTINLQPAGVKCRRRMIGDIRRETEVELACQGVVPRGAC